MKTYFKLNDLKLKHHIDLEIDDLKSYFIKNVYLVGGAVRDNIICQPPNDVDFAVEAKFFSHTKINYTNNN